MFLYVTCLYTKKYGISTEYHISLVIRQSFSFQNNPKNVDLSYEMDLDLWDLVRKGKTCIIANFHKTDVVICSHSREGKTLSYRGINTLL